MAMNISTNEPVGEAPKAAEFVSADAKAHHGHNGQRHRSLRACNPFRQIIGHIRIENYPVGSLRNGGNCAASSFHSTLRK
jgi:hypothetical protein